MDSPLSFSFLSAVKDGFSDFRKTYPSVLGQTDPDFEWIIIDDGSATPLASAFPDLAADPRVRIFRNDPGHGQTRSLNEGIREAKGTWIVRMDGDDLCAPDRLKKIRKALSTSPAAEILFSDYHVIDGNDRAWAEVRTREPLSSRFFEYLSCRNNPICHPTVAFKRLKNSGRLRLFREDLVNAQDYALWKEIFNEQGPSAFVHLAAPVISYRVVRDSLSGARAREQEVEKKAIREGHVLSKGEQSRPLLSEAQKDAMQSYRLLYYRFIGASAEAPIAEDLALLKGTLAMRSLFPKAVFYLIFRPLRKFLLRGLFAGIYE